MERAFAVHMLDLGLIHDIPYGPLGLPGIIYEHRVRSKPLRTAGCVLTHPNKIEIKNRLLVICIVYGPLSSNNIFMNMYTHRHTHVHAHTLYKY